MLIFLLQSVWLYISELAGKDLELDIILKFLIYVSPRLVILVLPLTILLSSIMVFGSLSENYEFAAMNASGISLQRSMRSLILYTFFKVAFLGSGNLPLISVFNIFSVSGPEILTTATPAIPGPEDKAYIVIIIL